MRLPAKGLLPRRAMLQTTVTAVATGLLAACTRAATQQPAAATPKARTSPITLTFLSWRPIAMDQFEPIWKEYEQRNLVRFEVDKTGDYGQTKLITMLAGDAAPDLWDGRTDALPKIYDSGAVLELSSFLSRDRINLTKDWALTGIERWRQKVYGVPYWVEPFAIYYNKTLFRQKGVADPWERTQNRGDWTIEEMVEAARKITDPQNDLWGLDWGLGNYHTIGPLIWTHGVSHMQYDPNIEFQLAIPESLQAHRTAMDWMMNLKINIQSPLPEAADARRRLQGDRPGIATTGGTNLFALGKIGIHWRSVNDWRRMWPLIGNTFEWDMLPVPSIGGKPGGSWTAGHPLNAWARTKYPEDVWNFMKWMMHDEFQNYLAENKYLVPAKLAIQPKFFQPPQQYAYQHPQVFADVYKRPYGVLWSHYNAVKNEQDYGREITRIYTGEVALESGLRDLTRLLNQDIEYGGGENPFKGLRWPFRSG
jgi:ABC-type glycerol-3-phosphate transport system substrate-binding protein